MNYATVLLLLVCLTSSTPLTGAQFVSWWRWPPAWMCRHCPMPCDHCAFGVCKTSSGSPTDEVIRRENAILKLYPGLMKTASELLGMQKQIAGKYNETVTLGPFPIPFPHSDSNHDKPYATVEDYTVERRRRQAAVCCNTQKIINFYGQYPNINNELKTIVHLQHLPQPRYQGILGTNCARFPRGSSSEGCPPCQKSYRVVSLLVYDIEGPNFPPVTFDDFYVPVHCKCA